MKKILILVGFVVLLTACSPKRDAIDEDQFIRIMNDEGFSIKNVESQFEQYGYFEEAYLAIDSNNNYQIEFYELEEENYDLNFYNNNKSKFENEKSSTYVDSNMDLKNINKYTLTTNNKYKVVSRIDDTVIYLDVDKKYKKEVNDILKKLGY